MRYKKILAVVLVSVCAVILFGCTGAGESDNFFVKFDEVKRTFESASEYSYEMTIETATLSNYDAQNRVLPANKTVKESDKWDRPLLSYKFIKKGADWYAELVFTDTKKDENGFPVFSDKDNNRPEYVDSMTAKFFFLSGSLRVSVNGSGIYDGDLESFDAEQAGYEIIGCYGFYNIAEVYFEEANANAVFFSHSRKWFSKDIFVCSTYGIKEREAYYGNGVFLPSADILSGGEKYIPYGLSPNKEGADEDLRFDWKNIDSVLSETRCYTAKKGVITTIEFYREIFGSNYKKSVQIWNNNEVETWSGDGVFKSVCTVEFKYPDKNTNIQIPPLS
jgi:hypothetical protein